MQKHNLNILPSLILVGFGILFSLVLMVSPPLTQGAEINPICGNYTGDRPPDGIPCASAPNACGGVSYGYSRPSEGISCATFVQTGTGKGGTPSYSYVPVSTPGLPAGYGATCYSASNSCGSYYTGSIQCNGSCSVGSAPPNPSGYGNSCTSAANACGQTNSGTIQCNGSCSAGTPANPSGYGSSCTSAANACGQTNSGTIQCNGSCSASEPSLPDGYGTSCESAANSCGMRSSGIVQCNGQCSSSVPSENLCAPDATMSIQALPSFVDIGDTTTVSWSSENADSCSISGDNGDSWTGTSGSETSSPIVDTTTYTITCIGINTGTEVTTALVKVTPVFQEK